MVKVRKRGEAIRRFILDNVENHSPDIVTFTAKKFNITRQAAIKHVQRLVEQGSVVIAGGNTKKRRYLLHRLAQWEIVISLEVKPEEDQIWRNEIGPKLGELPDNVRAIWHYGFTEMLNNAIDHSGGKQVVIHITKKPATTELVLSDDGVGIFKKIQATFGLEDERHAVLELSKGKLTTDPQRHTGEGIFFTSRMFDAFHILSGNVFFSHAHAKEEDWILENRELHAGTSVSMELINNTARTTKIVFDEYTSGDVYGFNKTVVPVCLCLAQYGNELLISRSQAKRLLAHVDRFKVVVLDFDNVAAIGQAFADEVFRVFVKQHPQIEVVPVKTNEAVQQMIRRAQENMNGSAVPPSSNSD